MGSEIVDDNMLQTVKGANPRIVIGRLKPPEVVGSSGRSDTWIILQGNVEYDGNPGGRKVEER